MEVSVRHQILPLFFVMTPLGKYHFLPPGGAPGIWEGGTHEFWKSKGGTEELLCTLRGEQKNFTDPNKKLNGHNINLYIRKI